MPVLAISTNTRVRGGTSVPPQTSAAPPPAEFSSPPDPRDAPAAHRIGTLGHCGFLRMHHSHPAAYALSSLGPRGSRELVTHGPRAPTPRPGRPETSEEPLCAPGGTAVPGPHALQADSRAEEPPWEGCGVPMEGNPCPRQGLFVTPGSRPSTPSRPQKSTGH